MHHGVVVCGLSNPPSAMPTHASFLYSRNVANFLALIVVDGELRPDFDDEIVGGQLRGAGRRGRPRPHGRAASGTPRDPPRRQHHDRAPSPAS